MDKVSMPAEETLTNTPADNKEPVERPSWLPENFETPEKMTEAYKSLQAEYTRKSQELADLKKAQGDKPKPDDAWKEGDEPPKEEATEPTEAKEDNEENLLPGFENSEISEISQYAWDNGELTEEHYAKLAEKGYSKAVVDQFMQGQFAAAEGQTQALYNAGGGQENVSKMFTWAQANLTEAEIARYDAKFDAGGADAIMAMENLKAKYEASGEAVTGKRVTGSNAPKGNTDVFTSTAQVVEAMSDPRYKSDPAYNKSVQDKLARSKVF